MNTTVSLSEAFQLFIQGLSEAGITVEIQQQPQAAAPARRSKPKSPAKPVSTAQHSSGNVWEVAFGVRADGTLTDGQKSRARRFFDDLDYVEWGHHYGSAISMQSIVDGIRDVNAALRGENSSTVRYWAVFNAPKGRLTDHEVRLMLRQQRQSR